MTTKKPSPEPTADGKPDILDSVRAAVAEFVSAKDAHFKCVNHGWILPEEIERQIANAAAQAADLMTREDFPAAYLTLIPAAESVLKTCIDRAKDGEDGGEPLAGNTPPDHSFWFHSERFAAALDALLPAKNLEPRMESVSELISQKLTLDQLRATTGLPIGVLQEEMRRQALIGQVASLEELHKSTGTPLGERPAIPAGLSLDPQQYPAAIAARAEVVQRGLEFLPQLADLRALVKSARAAGYID